MTLSTQDRESIIKLKLLAGLKIGDKINTRYLAIQEDSFTTKISRYMYGETRYNTVVFVRNTIEQCIAIKDKTADQKIKAVIIQDLANAKRGVIALQETYLSDVRVHSELEEIIQNMG